MQKEINIFQSNPLFTNLSKEEILDIINSGTIKEYETGTEISCLTNKNRYLMLIISGKTLVTKQNGGKTVFLRHLSQGEIFGVATLLSDEPYTTTITAMKKSKIYCLDEEKVTALIHKNGVFAENYIRFLTSRIKYLGDKIDAYTAASAESRIARYLLSLSEKTSEQIVLNVSLSKLADMLDIGRASLYRVLNEIEEQKLIKRNKRTVIICDREKLREMF